MVKDGGSSGCVNRSENDPLSKMGFANFPKTDELSVWWVKFLFCVRMVGL